MEDKSNDLSIIVLNFNGQQWLEKLLPSLKINYLSKTTFQVEVVVVDNASTDPSISFLKTIDWIRLIESDRNGGFSFGNNLALKDNRAKYVMLLNSDTEFTEENSNLDILIEYMNKHETAGIITPKVELTNGQPDRACHRGEPTLWAAFTYFMGLEKLFPKSRLFAKYHQSYKNLMEIHPIDACTGAAMLVRTSALEKVGLLDERFFMYAEDVDWCKRFRETGYQIVYNPEVKIIHHKYKSGMGNSSKTAKSNATYWFYETMLQYYDKHYKDQYPGIFRDLLKLFISLKKGKQFASNYLKH